MNLLCDQSAALRARSPLAYPQGMSRGSLRGAFHLDLLVTVPGRITFFLAALLCLVNIAVAGELVSIAGDMGPKLDIGKGGHCVEDPKFMRSNHFKLILHQRVATVRQGIRGSKYELTNCVECHASKVNHSVLGTNQNFCQGCHVYAAVKIDCFECHSSKPREFMKSSELAAEDVK
jgi:[DsrC]-trisulfide reductase subunit J